jgi:hypothetical protein
MTTQITVTRRSDDFKAELGKGQWEAGKSPESAVQRLRESFPEAKALPLTLG